jgi:hypothetical protein
MRRGGRRKGNEKKIQKERKRNKSKHNDVSESPVEVSEAVERWDK